MFKKQSNFYLYLKYIFKKKLKYLRFIYVSHKLYCIKMKFVKFHYREIYL